MLSSGRAVALRAQRDDPLRTGLGAFSLALGPAAARDGGALADTHTRPYQGDDSGEALRPLYRMSGCLRGGVPVFDIRKAAGDTDMLIRTPELGSALAKALGPHAAALMRGHGAVVVAADLPQAVFRSVYTELNARLQAQAISLGGTVTYLDDEEARKAEATMGSTGQRPWELWRRKAMGKWADRPLSATSHGSVPTLRDCFTPSSA